MAKFTVKAYAVVEVEIEADTPEQAWEKYDNIDIFSTHAEDRDSKEQVYMDWFMSDCMTEDLYDSEYEWIDERSQ